MELGELIKLVIESWVQYIGHIAWPLAIVIILIVFRRAIIDKLRGLTEFRGLGVGAKFAIEEAQKEISKRLKFSEITKKDLDWDKYLDALEQWASWLLFYMSELSINYLGDIQPEESARKIKKAMPQFNMVVNKLNKERPGSAHLKALNKNREELIKTLKFYDNIKSQPKRTRAEMLLDFFEQKGYETYEPPSPPKSND